jgi:hypothetical protein
MTKIVITMELGEEWAEPDHAMGITEEGHIALQDALAEFGTDVTITKAEA